MFRGGSIDETDERPQIQKRFLAALGEGERGQGDLPPRTEVAKQPAEPGQSRAAGGQDSEGSFGGVVALRQQRTASRRDASSKHRRGRVALWAFFSARFWTPGKVRLETGLKSRDYLDHATFGLSKCLIKLLTVMSLQLAWIQ